MNRSVLGFGDNFYLLAFYGLNGGEFLLRDQVQLMDFFDSLSGAQHKQLLKNPNFSKYPKILTKIIWNLFFFFLKL
jgi:hypothetical protein